MKYLPNSNSPYVLLVYLFTFFPNKISEKWFKIFHECFLLSKSQTVFISVVLPTQTARFPVNKQKKKTLGSCDRAS